MRKLILFKLFVIAYAASCCATEFGDTTNVSLSEIIAKETLDKTDYENVNLQRDIWSHTTFLNISYNKTKFSSDEFPSTLHKLSHEYKNDIGIGLQMGHTYNLHKKPIGSVMFVGLDFTWMDINFNKYKADTEMDFTPGEQIKNLPWHNEKMTLGYAMSIGPSLTLYPFATLHSKGADKIRLHFYFHVGYGAEGALIKDVSANSAIKDQWAWAHGLHTAFGGNITWDHIGIGYEFRNDGSLKYKPIDNDFGTNKIKVKEKAGRLYLQFRF